MPEVSYRTTLDYLRDARTGDRFPGLWIGVSRPNGHRTIEVQVHLDSGTELSLFDGEIAHGIGLELGRGTLQTFGTSVGTTFTTRLHRVRLGHEALGELDLRIAFSEQRLARDLLGRDFFNMFRVGFREHPSILLFEPEE